MKKSAIIMVVFFYFTTNISAQNGYEIQKIDINTIIELLQLRRWETIVSWILALISGFLFVKSIKDNINFDRSYEMNISDYIDLAIDIWMYGVLYIIGIALSITWTIREGIITAHWLPLIITLFLLPISSLFGYKYSIAKETKETAKWEAIYLKETGRGLKLEI